MSIEPIELSEEQKQLIFQAVGRRVGAIVTNTPDEKLQQELGNLSEKSVLGAFVSLKRHGQLRSCMGCLAQAYPLADALENAATRASKDDPRFAPISPAELLELTLEVWILWGMKQVDVPGKDRAKEIEIGRHGVILERGNDRGLLLPGVATEHQMDAVTFLEACARKAGLPLTAWSDDSVTFSTFEGVVMEGPFYDVQIRNQTVYDAMGRSGPLAMMLHKKTGPAILDVQKLRELSEGNFFLIADNLTPTFYRSDAFDGNVAGIAFSMQFPDRGLLVCSKIGPDDDIPLQAGLIDLIRILVQQVYRMGITPQERLDARLDLTVLWNRKVLGNGTDYDATKIDQMRHSIMLLSEKGWVLQYNPDVPVQGALNEAFDYLQVTDRLQTQVCTFETMSTTQHLLASSVSKPIIGPSERQPAVAGSFYPRDVALMNADLDRMLAAGPITKSDGFVGSNRPEPEPLHGAHVPPGEDRSGGIGFAHSSGVKKRPSGTRPSEFFAAALVPHAGWVYSGRLAAQTLARVKFPEQAIIFAPKHRSGGPDWAVAPHKTWVLPGRSVESDVHLAQSLVEMVDFMHLDSNVHAEEHSIEVQLPIIARLSPKTKVLGVLMQSCTWEVLQEGAIQLAAFLLRQPQQPLLIISTDMNHFATEEGTRTVDQMALSAIRSLDPQALLDVVSENRISMCGAISAVFVMETLRQMGQLNECVEVGYTTSAEASGDHSRVVGYAGMLFR